MTPVTLRAFGSRLGGVALLVAFAAGCTSPRPPEIGVEDPFGLAAVRSSSAGPATPAGASDHPPPPLPDGPVDITTLLELARDYQPTLRAAAARLEAARNAAWQAGIGPNPRLEVETEEAPINEGFLGDAAYALKLSVELPTSGRLAANRAAGVAEAHVAANQMLVVSAEVLEGVLTRSVEVLTARERLAATRKNKAAADRILDMVQRLVDGGTIPPAQQARAEAAVGRATNAVEEAERELAEHRSALASVIGVDPETLPALAAELTLPESVALPPLAQLLERAIGPEARNPWLVVARSRIKARERGIVAADAAARGNVELNTGLRYAADEEEAQLTLGVSIPLPFVNRNQGGRAAARANRNAAIADERVASVRALGKIRRAVAAIESHARQLTVWREKVLPAARKAVTGAEASVRTAALSAFELVEAQSALHEGQLEVLETRRKLWLAAVQLQVQVGDLEQFDMLRLLRETR